MAKRKKPRPDFVETQVWDPVRSATERKRPVDQNSSIEERKNSDKEEKKKVGFYLSTALWERFNRTFYELKLEGAIAGNKSRLVEAALTFALDDLEQGQKSTVKKLLQK